MKNGISQRIRANNDINIDLCKTTKTTTKIACARQTFGIDQIIPEVTEERTQPENVVAFVDPCISMQEHPFVRLNPSSSGSPTRPRDTSVAANVAKESTLKNGFKNNGEGEKMEFPDAADLFSSCLQTVGYELEMSLEDSSREVEGCLISSEQSTHSVQDDMSSIVSENDISVSVNEQEADIALQVDPSTVAEPQQTNEDEVSQEAGRNSNSVGFPGGDGQNDNGNMSSENEMKSSLKRVVFGRQSLSLGVGGSYESNSLDRCNSKKRSLLSVRGIRSVDDAVVPSSTLRSELELEELNLKVQEFQSKKDHHREGMKSKLKRLSAFYTGGGDEDATLDLNSSSKTRPGHCEVLKETSCINSSFSSLDEVTTQSNASLNYEEIRLRPPKKYDRDPRTIDEGFESESLSDPNTSSQRSSMCSAGDFDSTAVRSERLSVCGVIGSSRGMSDDSEDGPVGDDSGCGASYFSRSIDSIVVKPELSPVDVCVDEADSLSPNDRLSGDSTLASVEDFPKVALLDGTNSAEDSLETVITPKTGRIHRSGSTPSKDPLQGSAIPKPSSAGSATNARLSLPSSKNSTKDSGVSPLCTPRKASLGATLSRKVTTPQPKDPERPKKPQQRLSQGIPVSRSTLGRASVPQPKLPSTRDASMRPKLNEFVRGSTPRTAIPPPTLRNNKKAAAELRSRRLPQDQTPSDSPMVQVKAQTRPSVTRSFTTASSGKKDPAKQSRLPLGVIASSMRESASESMQNRAGRRSGVIAGSAVSLVTKASAASSKLGKPTVNESSA